MRDFPSRRFVAAVVALLAALLPLVASIGAGAAQPAAGEPVVVTSATVAFDESEPERRRFGGLTYLGGIHVKSTHEKFGGLSGLELSSDGSRFVAISDVGDWITGRIVYRDGSIAGLGDVAVAPIRGAPGESMRRKFDKDAEGLAAISPQGLDGDLLVSFERRHRLAVYRFGARGVAARPRYLKLPDDVAELDRNKGLEAVAMFPPGSRLAGSVIAIAERHLDADGNHTGWLITAGKAEKFALKRSNEFDITDLKLLDGGDMLVLERRYSLILGPAMRLRRIPADKIAPGALLDGELLIEAQHPQAVDNMEGLALHRAPDGKLVVSIVSDDNFRSAQRTLLLQFQLQE